MGFNLARVFELINKELSNKTEISRPEFELILSRYLGITSKDALKKNIEWFCKFGYADSNLYTVKLLRTSLAIALADEEVVAATTTVPKAEDGQKTKAAKDKSKTE